MPISKGRRKKTCTHDRGDDTTVANDDDSGEMIPKCKYSSLLKEPTYSKDILLSSVHYQERKDWHLFARVAPRHEESHVPIHGDKAQRVEEELIERLC